MGYFTSSTMYLSTNIKATTMSTVLNILYTLSHLNFMITLRVDYNVLIS